MSENLAIEPRGQPEPQLPQPLHAVRPWYSSEMIAAGIGHQCQPSRSNPAAIVRPLSRIGSGAQGKGVRGGIAGSPARPLMPTSRSLSS